MQKNWLLLLAGASLALVLSACGGGGSSAAAPSSSTGPVVATSTPLPTATPIHLPPQSTTPNVQVIVSDDSMGAINRLYTSVTLCVPGTTQCQTIDHIVIDTGSSGLRIFNSALTLTGLPAIKNAQGTLSTCQEFAASYMYGSLKQADIKMAGEVAANQPIQIVGDTQFPSAPDSCSNGNPQIIGMGNGVIGIDSASQQSNQGSMVYYQCANVNAGSCVEVLPTVSQQINNPISAFATDYNGVILKMNDTLLKGSNSVTGQMIFGIGTQANNTVSPAAQLFKLNSYAELSAKATTGTSYNRSFFDTGSPFIAYSDPASKIPVDQSGFFAPVSPTTQTLNTNIIDINQKMISMAYLVTNQTALDTTQHVFDNLVESFAVFSATFDWGLSFFFGKTVYMTFDGQNSVNGQGPWIAF